MTNAFKRLTASLDSTDQSSATTRNGTNTFKYVVIYVFIWVGQCQELWQLYQTQDTSNRLKAPRHTRNNLGISASSFAITDNYNNNCGYMTYFHFSHLGWCSCMNRNLIQNFFDGTHCSNTQNLNYTSSSLCHRFHCHMNMLSDLTRKFYSPQRILQNYFLTRYPVKLRLKYL